MTENITPRKWLRIERILDQALDLTAMQRATFLDETCAGDPELRGEIERLLEADRAPDNFLDLPLEVPGSEFAGLSAVGDGTIPTEQFEGKYRILRRLGEGGMGEVFEADQFRPVRRRVALKLVKSGMDSKQVVARFESERQALALMNHPNIASVFDAGETLDGRSYFVMEYVKGVPITDHCDTYCLGTRERLALFCQVCDGVHHAHQNGVIHRDIKPSNLLVVIHDDKATPKIIDFGVAKAIGQPLTDDPSVTLVGQMIGTPAYMSPEQAEMTAQDIDLRTDVYSLGALLYELLLGVLPFEGLKLVVGDLAEFRRKIRTEDPTKPSTRLTALRAETSAEAAVKRNTNPESLAQQLSGDLDRITMKALAKDRTRRHGSAAALAADLRSYLAAKARSAKREGDSLATEVGGETGGDDDEMPLAWIAVVKSRVDSERQRLFQISRRRTNIGRNVKSHDLNVNDQGVGRSHAAIRFEPAPDSERSEFVLYDLASTNGTLLNGKMLVAPRTLADGDTIVVGTTTLVFKRL